MIFETELTLVDGLEAHIQATFIHHPEEKGDRITPTYPEWYELDSVKVLKVYLDGEDISCSNSFRIVHCLIETSWADIEEQLVEEFHGNI